VDGARDGHGDERMVDAKRLTVGELYFAVTYPEPTMDTPIIITYRFLGKDPEGVEQDVPGSHYYFRCLPPFQSAAEDDEEVRSLAPGWAEVFPGAFAGWGERVPSSLTEDHVRGLSTLDGVIEELAALRSRRGPPK
jgi:hypothetical protein